MILAKGEYKLNRDLTGLIRNGLGISAFYKSLKDNDIIVVQSVGNRSNYGFSARDIERGWKGDPSKDAELFLALQHLNFDSHIRGRYPQNVVKIAAAKFPFNTQMKLMKSPSDSLKVLKEAVQNLEWEDVFNWSAAHLVVDQGNSFEFFRGKKSNVIDLSYDGIYRLLEIHAPLWRNHKNSDLKEYFKGFFFDNFGWSYVSHGTTSFAVPVASVIVKRYQGQNLRDLPKGYFRPFRAFEI